MRIRNGTVAFLAGLLLAVFIPVFYSILFIGNKMDYNAQHKIETLQGNGMLFLFGMGGTALCDVVCRVQ